MPSQQQAGNAAVYNRYAGIAVPRQAGIKIGSRKPDPQLGIFLELPRVPRLCDEPFNLFEIGSVNFPIGWVYHIKFAVSAQVRMPGRRSSDRRRCTSRPAFFRPESPGYFISSRSYYTLSSAGSQGISPLIPVRSSKFSSERRRRPVAGALTLIICYCESGVSLLRAPICQA